MMKIRSRVGHTPRKDAITRSLCLKRAYTTNAVTHSVKDYSNTGKLDLFQSQIASISLFLFLPFVPEDAPSWFANRTRRNFWGSIDNQRKYFDWVSSVLKVEKPDDWYRIRVADVEEREGGGLLCHYYQR